MHVTAQRHGWTDGDRDAITVDIEPRPRRRARPLLGAISRTATAGRTSPSRSRRPRRCDSTRKAVRSASTTWPARWPARPGVARSTSTARSATRRSTRMGGSIAVTGHRGAVTARTKGGSVKVEGALTGTVDASTLGGSIRIDGVDGTVRAETMGGSVQVSGRLRGVCSPDDGRRFGVGSGWRAARTWSSTRPAIPSSTDVPGLTATRGHIEGTVGDRRRRHGDAADLRRIGAGPHRLTPDPRGTVWARTNRLEAGRRSRGSRHARPGDSRCDGRRRHRRRAGVPGRRRGRRRPHHRDRRRARRRP